MNELADYFDVSRPAISKHLRILKDARVVRERREGRNRIYELNPAGLERAARVLRSVLEPGARRLQTRS